MKVYGDAHSGNCYKVKLILVLLRIKHEWLPINVVNQETQTPEFLKMNPNGQVPTVVLNDGRILCESNAILGYFAEGTPYLPQERYTKAKVYEWLFFEQNSHEPAIAVTRFIEKYLGLPETRRAEYESLHKKGYKALDIMEQQLSKSPFLAGDTFTIADIALYAYTHVAHEGGYDLSTYPAILNWFRRIEQQPGYIAMGE